LRRYWQQRQQQVHRLSLLPLLLLPPLLLPLATRRLPPLQLPREQQLLLSASTLLCTGMMQWQQQALAD
jgi:hypothetical protein